MKIIVNCISELHEVSKTILSNRYGRDIICFYGEMGVGKTTLIKSLCEVLEVIDNVNSPTFSLVNEYILNNKETIYHFDFYRIKNEDEAFDMGYEEYFYSGNICLIEWPEKVPAIIPDDVMKINITKKSDQRIIKIS